MKMKKQNKDWEKEWDANPEVRRNPKEFIRQLLAQKEKEVKMKLLRRVIRNLEARKEWSFFNKYFLRDNVLEYLNQVMKGI